MHLLTVLCVPVKRKPVWNENLCFRGGDAGGGGSVLRGEQVCLLPHLLGAGATPSSGPWLSLQWEGSAPGGCGLLARMLGSPAVSEGSFELSLLLRSVSQNKKLEPS